MRTPSYLPHTASLQKITGYTGTTGTEPVFGGGVDIQCRIANGDFSEYSQNGTLIKFDASMHTSGDVDIKTNDRVVFNTTNYNVVDVETTITKQGRNILKFIKLSI